MSFTPHLDKAAASFTRPGGGTVTVPNTVVVGVETVPADELAVLEAETAVKRDEALKALRPRRSRQR